MPVVLHIVESMSSGVLKYLQEITYPMSKNDFQHIIVHSRREYTPKNLKDLFHPEVKLVYLSMTSSINLMKDIMTIRKITQIIKDIQPDIIHLHSSKAGFLGRLATFFSFNRRVFYTPHGYSFLMSSEPFVKRAVFWLAELFLSQSSAKIIACSKSEYEYARKMKFFRKSYLLENALRVEYPLSNWGDRPYHIIGVGRLDAQKNPQLFIEIVSQLQKRMPSLKAVWVGDGPLSEECFQLTHKKDADIKFTGWLPHEQVLEYLNSSRLMLQTSKWEGLPYSVLEAFGFGIPVIATDIRSHRDVIVNGINGFIASSPKDFIEKTLTIMNDHQLAIKISNTTLEHFKEYYNYDAFIDKLYKIYLGNA